jgi:phage-related minor tail protein
MTVKKHGVHFDVTAENATDRALRAVEDNLGRVNKAADAVGRTLQGAFVATTAIAAGKAFATAAIEAEQASKRLDAVLKATGHSAGLTKDELDGMADAMAESTQFDDESLRNASAQLLKFGNIHGATFKEALKLSADLAAFMGTDIVSAAQAVGKALTSPTEGTTALEKQVGKFNSSAKDMIKSLQEQGREGAAQAAVLEILKGKIGGTAETLNTGLSRASSDAKKQWNEMLEAIGKTEPFQKTVKSGLGMVTAEFRRMKEIVENGTWTERALALFAMQSPAARALGYRPTLTPAAPAARNETKGGVGGAPAAMKLDDELTGDTMSERDIKSWKEMLKYRAEAAEKAKEQKKKDDREYVQDLERELAAEEQFEKDRKEGHDIWAKQILDAEKKFNEDRTEMWKQVFEAIDQEQTDAIEAGRVLLEGLEADAKKASDAAKDLGYAFESAFESAILEGKGVSDVLGGLAKDIGKIVLRETVTKPLGGWFTDTIGNLFKAEGGPVMAGEPYIVGERGPELMVPGMSGSIIPNDALRRGESGARGGDLTVHINAQGADAAGLRRVEAAITRMHQSFDERATSAVRRAMNLNGRSTAF